MALMTAYLKPMLSVPVVSRLFPSPWSVCCTLLPLCVFYLFVYNLCSPESSTPHFGIFQDIDPLCTMYYLLSFDPFRVWVFLSRTFPFLKLAILDSHFLLEVPHSTRKKMRKVIPDREIQGIWIVLNERKSKWRS